MIRAFFKEYYSWYIQYGVVMAGYLLIFWLYRLPLSYFKMTSLTILTLLILQGFGNYIRFKKKMKILQEFIYVNELNQLNSPSEQAYRSLIIKLKEAEAEAALNQLNNQKNTEALIKMWSHQMKLPLAAMSLMIQTNHTDIKDYQIQVLRLEHYLNNLLSYLKFNQHSDDFRFQVCSVKQLVTSVIKKSSQACIAKGISIAVDGDWQLSTDNKWLSFALTQIIDNAIKYSKPQGHIKVSIKEGSIFISDNGIGILEEDLPRLFEEGFTGYNGHEHQKATGLGLFMTKQILDKLNLNITISSQVDQGTLVVIQKKHSKQTKFSTSLL
ncbi:sensor histidine kinase [Streptococcus equi subsp. zooepidemicus]|uniref:sensor histidine kinase n=1 Tax=Streptococcus equi TaxID=1336 RepID=UPI001E34B430|nr:sensor histidine kinase [Streptococcus equi]MCD3387910.1 sensor histidine kinase [Streptococcus equi subsp. zooepidemicus]HEL0632139.1 sensor histidine kinase [Streptococcus equi subsp. zooepidemicus]HEL0683553.1 sensor histidine kinase [Streptococcus equi subsp. zooepidemicus]HEL1105478.1 sensor histidine kinase [Streptococcus equi subsp. zooepidemicus]